VDVIRVDSIEDARLAGYAQLGDERWLEAHGMFVAEGRFVVERLVTARRQRVLSVLANEAALAALGPALAGLEAPIFVCAPRFFERLTGHHFHRGCLALAERPTNSDARALAAEASALVVLDRVADADNVGSVFRSALAFGVDALWLGPGCADPLARKAIRTSMAATLRVPFARVSPPGLDPDEPGAASARAIWPECIAELEGKGFGVLALSPREPARELSEYALPGASRRFALVIGSEGAGLSPEVEALASTRLRIGMRPGIDSINLGVAAGIALHWLMQR
jgi:tRNA G18 (ribose-2'-O)-methylase SpoU